MSVSTLRANTADPATFGDVDSRCTGWSSSVRSGWRRSEHRRSAQCAKCHARVRRHRSQLDAFDPGATSRTHSGSGGAKLAGPCVDMIEIGSFRGLARQDAAPEAPGMNSRRPPEGAYLDRGCALSWLRLSAADQTETLRSRERGSKLLTHGPAVAWATECFAEWLRSGSGAPAGIQGGCGVG